MMMKMEEKNKLPEEAWGIAKFRIEAMPKTLKLSIGSTGALNKDQLIDHIEKRDDIGKMIAEAQINFLRTFKRNLKVTQ